MSVDRIAVAGLGERTNLKQCHDSDHTLIRFSEVGQGPARQFEGVIIFFYFTVC